ncbi:hypothetical protein PR202_gb10943 [Eleusine coracana subsp. coracana]|uniref:Uncharacterized protein n=1 Tax=Eleusine coracana subsp. coracana TaxID=191504 RepID=A0AAV5ELA6_ELECO|nr:hypothetical protein PR202_gb10943 [Eleusine coracana subsp. coracana]
MGEPLTTDQKLDLLIKSLQKNSDDINQMKTQYAVISVAVNKLQSDKHESSSSGGSGPQTFTIGKSSTISHKLQFPHYDGSEDPLPWLSKWK